MSSSPADLTRLQSALSDRYAVVREVGAGGMATVYLARDIKHDRHVALKVLRPELGAVLGVERFLSEIKVTAHLQHPHLLPLFDSGEANGLLFYVMPFVEGESLRARLDREHQLPIDEALRITLAVASALEYAHKQGVIHRDLKPENILLQHGEPVVSDFGIALAVSNAGGARVTQTGLSLGTPQYMSPEQATGDRDVDARSDIYSLAAVLYEMLTGEPPHSGKTAQAIIARVLTEKPHSARVTRDTVPEHIDAAMLRALSKLPADRCASAAEFVAALKSGSVTATGTANYGIGSGGSAGSGRSTTKTLVAALPWAVAAVAVGLFASARMKPEVEPPVVRFTIPVPRDVSFGVANSTLAVTAQGDAIVVGSMVQSQIGLFVRSLDNPAFTPVAGTAGARTAFFSPDGSQIGFVSGGQLRVVPRGGGTIRALATATGLGPTASWSERNEIAFSTEGTGRGDGGIFLVPAGGGEARLLAHPDTSKRENEYFAPSFLPGGKVILFTIASNGYSSFKLGAVTTGGKLKRLDLDAVSPQYTNDGRLVFENLSGVLSSVPFDAAGVRPTGAPSAVIDGIAQRPNTTSMWAISPTGTLVYVGASGEATLVAVQRSGVFAPLNAATRLYRRPQISPDGRRIVVEVAANRAASTGQPTTDLWMIDIAGQTMNRFSFGEPAMDPAWTRDGKRVAFSRPSKSGADANGYDLWWQPADGAGSAEPIYQGPGSQWPYGFSTDGKTILIDESPGGGNIRLATIELGVKDAKPKPLFESEFSNRLSRMSKDGKWIAYASNENGRVEVFVRPFPGPGGKWQVSTEGGDQPLWNPNGGEIFFRSGTKVMVATVSTTPTFSVTNRKELFDDIYDQAGTQNWDVFPDGNRFVMIKPSGSELQQLSVVVNWTRELAKVGGRK